MFRPTAAVINLIVPSDAIKIMPASNLQNATKKARNIIVSCFFVVQQVRIKKLSQLVVVFNDKVFVVIVVQF